MHKSAIIVLSLVRNEASYTDSTRSGILLVMCQNFKWRLPCLVPMKLATKFPSYTKMLSFKWMRCSAVSMIPGFDRSILRGIWEAADEAVLNKVLAWLQSVPAAVPAWVAPGPGGRPPPPVPLPPRPPAVPPPLRPGTGLPTPRVPRQAGRPSQHLPRICRSVSIQWNRIHCNENPIYAFLFWELRDLSPNFHIPESVGELIE
jgi:hypothetical protein